METLEQRRARHALKSIRDIENQQYGHYVSYVSALPATIVTNGLGQALVMLLAKAGNSSLPHRFLFNHVSSWLVANIEGLGNDQQSIIDALMGSEQKTYLHAQAEAIAYLSWLKQFARAYLREQEGQPNDAAL